MLLDGRRLSAFFFYDLTIRTDSFLLGCEEDKDRYLVECLGVTCDACCLDGLVR